MVPVRRRAPLQTLRPDGQARPDDPAGKGADRVRGQPAARALSSHAVHASAAIVSTFGPRASRSADASVVIRSADGSNECQSPRFPKCRPPRRLRHVSDRSVRPETVALHFSLCYWRSVVPRSRPAASRLSYHAPTGQHCVTRRGRRIHVGTGRDEALARYHRLALGLEREVLARYGGRVGHGAALGPLRRQTEPPAPLPRCRSPCEAVRWPTAFARRMPLLRGTRPAIVAATRWAGCR